MFSNTIKGEDCSHFLIPENCYGMRWISEGFFSAVKRIFGENIRVTSIEGMIQEVKMKFLFYNIIVHAV